MQKRKFIGLLVVLVVTVFGVAMPLDTSQAATGWEILRDLASANSTFLASTDNVNFTTASSYTLTFNGVSDHTNVVDGKTYKKWGYTTNWSNNTAAQVFVLVPAGCGEDLKYFCDNNTGLKLCEVIATTAVIDNDPCTIYKELKITPNSASNAISFYTEKPSTPSLTMFMGVKTLSDVSSNNPEYLAMTSFGPSLPSTCWAPAYVPVMDEELKVIEGFHLKIKKNAGETCGGIVFHCDNTYANCTEVRPLKSIAANVFPAECFPNGVYDQTVSGCAFNEDNKEIFDCGDTEFNQGCRECVISHHGSPGCKTYTVFNSLTGYASSYTLCR